MMQFCTFLPPIFEQRLAVQGSNRAAIAARNLSLDQQLRDERKSPTPKAALTRLIAVTGEQRSVYTSANQDALPGTLLWSESQAPGADAQARNAFDYAGKSFDFYKSIFSRSSVDAASLPIVLSVHYAQNYCNALWNGSELVFGDGDGVVFNAFTNDLDAIGHEFTHGVVQYTCGLTYQGQSGALNEHLADVFGSMIKQYANGQDAAAASWLIGETIFKNAPTGMAVRSLKDPGNAFDLPGIGKDPQVATMAQFYSGADDAGGVHLNSGIPNHAFYLAAMVIGGKTWETIGPIWYAVMTNGSLTPASTFIDFAQATINYAERHAPAYVPVLRAAWQKVGVLASDAPPPAPPVAAGSK